MVKKIPQLYVVLIMLFLFSGTNGNAQPIQQQFKDLEAITGTWGMETKQGTIYERWQIKDDSTLQGYAFKLNGKDTILLENVELVLRENKIMYIPTVSGQNDQKPVVFTLASLKDKQYTFENKAHDFPQRVIYVLPDNNVLNAWIEGEMDGTLRKSVFSYKKVL